MFKENDFKSNVENIQIIQTRVKNVFMRIKPNSQLSETTFGIDVQEEIFKKNDFKSNVENLQIIQTRVKNVFTRIELNSQLLETTFGIDV